MALTPARAKVLGRQGGKASGKARTRLSLARVEEELGPLLTVEDAMRRLDRLGLVPGRTCPEGRVDSRLLILDSSERRFGDLVMPTGL